MNTVRICQTDSVSVRGDRRIRRQHVQYACCWGVVFCLTMTLGCHKKTPVDEIAAADSGVAILDRSLEFAPSDWPAWRGAGGSGVSAETDVPTQWSETENIAWQSDVPGRGHSSPIVVGDSVYLATAIESSAQQLVLAYDRASGKEKWRCVVHEGNFPAKNAVHQKATNANGTIACDGKHLYIAFLNNEKITASAIDLTGEVAWQRELGAFNSKFGYAASPVLYKSAVIFACDNQGGGYLAAVDGDTGSIVWRVARPAVSSYSSAALASVGGSDQLLISGAGMIASYDPATGSENWTTECIAEATCGTVVCSGDKIYASGGYPDKETVCLTANGKRVWSERTKVYEPSLVASGAGLFAVTDDGIAYCWDAETGAVNWKKRLGKSYSASPVVCDGKIYVPNLSGETTVFEASADAFKLVAENSLGSDSYASPAIAGGQIFMRVGVQTKGGRRERLVCIGGSQ